jgi:hypothetical protein
MMMLDRVFWWGAVALGVPSSLGTIGFSILSFALWLSRPNPSRPSDPRMSESLVGVVYLLAEGIGKIFAGLAAAVEWIIHMLLAASFAGVLMSLLLWWISRGLAADALWARSVAGVIFLLLFLISALLSVSSGADMYRLLGLALAVGSGWSIYNLIHGVSR